MLGVELGTAWIEPMATWLPLSLALATFVSEDLACLAAGGLVASGELAFATASIACGLGIFGGDLLLYVLGRLVANGSSLVPFVQRLVPKTAGTAVRAAFDRRGGSLLFAARFLPGSRLPVYVAAGALRFPLLRFAGLLLAAAALWTPVVVGAAAGAGELARSQGLHGNGSLGWILVLAIGAGLLAMFLLRLCTSCGRRLLRAKWLRLSRFEYWPSFVCYAPVAFAMLWDGLRSGPWFAFTACNPGIPFGGLALESKGDILDQMPRDPDAAVAVAAYVRLRRTTRLQDRLDTVAELLMRGPVVLKPDQGERGSGVAVVRELAEAERWFQACPLDAIAQRWVGGEEYGIVWRRLPGGGSEIRSIARKVPPFVVGDGERTLDELLLADDRTLAMLALHRRRHRERLAGVPRRGERIALGELGTHCRGATFLDARSLRTEELERALHDFLATSPGLDFGRFDVRAPDDEALRRGEGLRVLEFNGVTGEPAHVYHPTLSRRHALRDLVAHWRAAAATGRANVANGRRAARLGELFSLLRRIRSRPRFEAPSTAAESASLQVFAGSRTAGGASS